MTFRTISAARKLQPGKRRLFIGAYGFEDRSLAWADYQKEQGDILNTALIFQYGHPKGENRILELRKILVGLGVASPNDIQCDLQSLHDIEDVIDKEFRITLLKMDEVIIDISAMTKLLILVCLCTLSSFSGTVRIVYSEPEDYVPTQEDYEKSKDDKEMIAKFPSRGFESIIRMKCLSSIRMQGQPVSLIAFTSFNEQLIRHMLGTINPYRLLFINGRPPRTDYAWRERATQEIHNRLREEYSRNNPINEAGLLTRTASTLDYGETIDRIGEIYKNFGMYERIICAATGSKMQTVGLFFSKIAHPDIHIEYPTPDSYFPEGISTGVRQVHEVVVPNFSSFLKGIHEEEWRLSNG